MNIIEKKKRQMGQGGFTLIELLVVIAILAVLAGLAVIGIGAMRSNADKTACEADKDTYETASEAFSVSNDGAYTDEAGLVAAGLIKAGRESKYDLVVNGTTGAVTSAADCP